MLAKHSDLLIELSPAQRQPVASVVYANEAYPDAMFRALIVRCRAMGLSLAGVLQHPALESAGRRCDVVLEDLYSGRQLSLFEDRGAGASGCRLNESALAEATVAVERSLEFLPDLLVLSKFGKVECEGGGFRDVIATAIGREIPVVIGVPERNRVAWRLFAGEFAVEFGDNTVEVDNWLAGL